MNRTLNVVRMQLVNRATYIWVPLIILGGTLLISFAIFGLISSSGADAQMFGGGAQAPLWYFGVVGVQALTLTFPFSQAMSVTRREFYLGTLITAALTALGLALLFVIGGFIEEATNAPTAAESPTTVAARPRTDSVSSSITIRPPSITMTCSSRFETSSIRWLDRMMVRGCSA